ncbi:hypothetical protein [Natrinema sp. SYSU A 869]|uniref:hypothetical protein n=1 Tax=Natrinema sp. SYSU A 869 TaxID=2871694 RepID=UPI001CA40408|nr:hypothetical protein [Natrinema sp. SYSU A 869]
MVSRENTVFAVTLGICFVAFLLGALAGLGGPFFAFVVLLVSPLLGSQLYLVVTDVDDRPSVLRVRLSLLLSALLSGVYGSVTVGFEQLAFRTTGIVLILVLVSYECRAVGTNRNAAR